MSVTKLPLPGCKSLAKNWQKFFHIMRYGKVIKQVTYDPVQQIQLMFEPELAKLLDPSEQEQLAQVCTEGAPSCTMRLKMAGPAGKEETRSGPLFQLQVIVQVPGKGQVQDLRNMCFSEGVALLEKQLKEGQVVENSRFLACSRRYIKLRDPEALAEEQLAANIAANQIMVEPVPAPKASSFRWQGRGSIVAAEPTAARRTPSSPGDGNAKAQVPASFKWCLKAVPLGTSNAAGQEVTVGKKRGREDDEESPTDSTSSAFKLAAAAASSYVDADSVRATKSIKIGPIKIVQ